MAKSSRTLAKCGKQPLKLAAKGNKKPRSVCDEVLIDEHKRCFVGYENGRQYVVRDHEQVTASAGNLHYTKSTTYTENRKIAPGHKITNTVKKTQKHTISGKQVMAAFRGHAIASLPSGPDCMYLTY